MGLLTLPLAIASGKAHNMLLALQPVWPDWAIYWTLSSFSKHLATINLPKSPIFLGNFCKGVKIFNFCSEIIFGQILQTFGDFYWSLCLQLKLIKWANFVVIKWSQVYIRTIFQHVFPCFSHFPIELFSTRRRRHKPAQVVSCRFYEMQKYRQYMNSGQ